MAGCFGLCVCTQNKRQIHDIVISGFKKKKKLLIN